MMKAENPATQIRGEKGHWVTLPEIHCSYCGKYKSRDNFYTSSSRTTHLQSRCKDCDRKHCRERYYKKKLSK